MAITVEFETTGLDPRVSHFNLYRKKPGEAVFTRIAQLPVQLQYTDLDGAVGDQYYYTFFDEVRFLESGPSPVITATNNLDTVTISGFAIGVDGLPTGEGVDVKIRLEGENIDSPVSDGQIITSLNQTVTTDADGVFVFEVVPNDRIYPGNTFYKVEYLDKRFYKEINLTDGNAQLFSTLADVNPLDLR